MKIKRLRYRFTPKRNIYKNYNLAPWKLDKVFIEIEKEKEIIAQLRIKLSKME